MGNEGSHPSSESGEVSKRLDNDLRLRWRRVRDSEHPLQGRDGHCACSCNGRLYMFGGVAETADGGYSETNDLLVFNPETESWSNVIVSGQIPPPRSAASMSAVGDNIYLFGGLSQTAGWMNNVFMFATGDSTWKELIVTGSGPGPRDKLASVTIGHKIYVFGGFGPISALQEDDTEGDEGLQEEDEEDEEGENSHEETQEAAKFGWFDDLFVFDADSVSWSQPMQMNKGGPTARAAHSMCAVSDNLVIFGGRDSVGRKNDLYVYNTVNRKWLINQQVTGLPPAPRSFHTSCAFGHRMMIIGGRGVNNEHFGDFNVLDTETWQWLQPSVEGDCPSPRGLHTATVVGKQLVVFGGSSDFDSETMQCQSYLADTYISDIDDLLKGKATQSVVVSEPTASHSGAGDTLGDTVGRSDS